MADIRLGVMKTLTGQHGDDFVRIRKMGFETCQLISWEGRLFTADNARKVKDAAEAAGVEMTAFWCGWEGPAVWNFYDGPITLGLLPDAYRFDRIRMLIAGVDFARMAGIRDFATHVGFIPENPHDPAYHALLSAVRHVAEACRKAGLRFLFETGQETPVTLLRAIQDIGLDNLGINLDPANLLLYGKANPVDALDIFGAYVRGVHAKDGEYPSDGRSLGLEKKLGEGRVDFPRLVAKLRSLGYRGALTIEREIEGDQQVRDIMEGKEFLTRVIAGEREGS